MIAIWWILSAQGFAAQSSPIPSELTTILERLNGARWEDRQSAFDALLSFAAQGRSGGDGTAIGAGLSGLFKTLPQSREPISVALIQLLARENRTVKAAAALSEAYLNYWADVLATVATLRDPRAIPYLVEDLATGRIAIESVAAFGSQALDAVLAELKSKESPLRSACLLTLSEMLEPRNADRIADRDRAKIKAALIQGASDSVYGVRISALQGLAKVPGEDVTALLQQLANGDPFSRAGGAGKPPVFPVRNAAAKALQGRPRG